MEKGNLIVHGGEIRYHEIPFENVSESERCDACGVLLKDLPTHTGPGPTGYEYIPTGYCSECGITICNEYCWHEGTTIPNKGSIESRNGNYLYHDYSENCSLCNGTGRTECTHGYTEEHYYCTHSTTGTNSTHYYCDHGYTSQHD